VEAFAYCVDLEVWLKVQAVCHTSKFEKNVFLKLSISRQCDTYIWIQRLLQAVAESIC